MLSVMRKIGKLIRAAGRLLKDWLSQTWQSWAETVSQCYQRVWIGIVPAAVVAVGVAVFAPLVGVAMSSVTVVRGVKDPAVVIFFGVLAAAALFYCASVAAEVLIPFIFIEVCRIVDVVCESFERRLCLV